MVDIGAGSVRFEAEINLQQLERQLDYLERRLRSIKFEIPVSRFTATGATIKELNKLVIKPKVDHRPLTALNKHLDKKKAHLKEIIDYFSENKIQAEYESIDKKAPPKVTVQESRIAQSSSSTNRRQNFQPIIQAISTQTAVLTKVLESGFIKNATNSSTKINQEIKNNKNQVKHSGQKVKQSIDATQGFFSLIKQGLLTKKGADLGSNIDKFMSAFSDIGKTKLTEYFGSLDLLGDAFGDLIANFSAQLLQQAKIEIKFLKDLPVEDIEKEVNKFLLSVSKYSPKIGEVLGSLTERIGLTRVATAIKDTSQSISDDAQVLSDVLKTFKKQIREFVGETAIDKEVGKRKKQTQQRKKEQVTPNEDNVFLLQSKRKEIAEKQEKLAGVTTSKGFQKEVLMMLTEMQEDFSIAKEISALNNQINNFTEQLVAIESKTGVTEAEKSSMRKLVTERQNIAKRQKDDLNKILSQSRDVQSEQIAGTFKQQATNQILASKPANVDEKTFLESNKAIIEETAGQLYSQSLTLFSEGKFTPKELESSNFGEILQQIRIGLADAVAQGETDPSKIAKQATLSTSQLKALENQTGLTSEQIESMVAQLLSSGLESSVSEIKQVAQALQKQSIVEESLKESLTIDITEAEKEADTLYQAILKGTRQIHPVIKSIIKDIEKVYGANFDTDKMPTIVSSNLKQGADAGYMATGNLILTSSELKDKIDKNQPLTPEEVNILRHEFDHAFRLEFGSIEGLLGRITGDIPVANPYDLTAEENRTIPAQIAQFYSPEKVDLESSAYIAGRNMQKEFKQPQDLNVQSEMLKRFGKQQGVTIPFIENLKKELTTLSSEGLVDSSQAEKLIGILNQSQKELETFGLVLAGASDEAVNIEPLFTRIPEIVKLTRQLVDKEAQRKIITQQSVTKTEPATSEIDTAEIQLPNANDIATKLDKEFTSAGVKKIISLLNQVYSTKVSSGTKKSENIDIITSTFSNDEITDLIEGKIKDFNDRVVQVPDVVGQTNIRKKEFQTGIKLEPIPTDLFQSAIQLLKSDLKNLFKIVRQEAETMNFKEASVQLDNFIESINELTQQYSVNKSQSSQLQGLKSVGTSLQQATQNNEQLQLNPDAGRNILLGQIKGLESALPELISVTNKSQQMMNQQIEDFWEIKSPSRRMMRVARHLVNGLINGWKSQFGNFEKEVETGNENINDAVSNNNVEVDPLLDLDSIKQEMDDLINEVSQARNEFNNFIDSSESLNNVEPPNKITAFFEGLKGKFDIKNIVSTIKELGKAFLSFVILEKITGMFRQLMDGAFEAGMEMQRFERSISFASGKDGAKVLTEIYNNAQNLGIAFREAAAGYSQLVSSTMGTSLSESAGDMATSFQKSFAVFGLDNQSQERAFLAISQMASKGKVSSEELRQQLGEALPGAMGIAARSMGMLTEDFNKLLESGQVLSNDFLPKFAKQLELETDLGLADATESAMAQFNRLQNNAYMLKAQLGEIPINFVTGEIPVIDMSWLDILNSTLTFINQNLEIFISLALSASIVVGVQLAASFLKLNAAIGLTQKAFAILKMSGKALMPLLLPFIKLIAITYALQVSIKALAGLINAGSGELKSLSKQMDGLSRGVRTIRFKLDVEETPAWKETLGRIWGVTALGAVINVYGKVKADLDFKANIRNLDSISESVDQMLNDIETQTSTVDLGAGISIQDDFSDESVRQFQDRMAQLRQEVQNIDLQIALVSDENDFENLSKPLIEQRKQLEDEMSRITEESFPDIGQITRTIQGLEASIAEIDNIKEALLQQSNTADADELAKIEQQLEDLDSKKEELETQLGRVTDKQDQYNEAIKENIDLYTKQIRVLTEVRKQMANLDFTTANESIASQTAITQARARGDISEFEFDTQMREARSVEINTRLSGQNSLAEELKADIESKLGALDPANVQSLSQILGVDDFAAALENQTISPEAIAQTLNSPNEAIKEALENSPNLKATLEASQEYLTIWQQINQQKLESANIEKEESDAVRQRQADLRDFNRQLEDLDITIADYFRQRQRALEDFELQLQDISIQIQREGRDLLEQYQDLQRSLNQQLRASANELSTIRRNIERQARTNQLRGQLDFGASGAFSDLINLFDQLQASENDFQVEKLTIEEQRLANEQEVLNIARQIRALNEQKADLERNRFRQLRDLSRQQEDFVLQQVQAWRNIQRQVEDMEIRAREMGIAFSGIAGSLDGINQSYAEIHNSIAQFAEQIANSSIGVNGGGGGAIGETGAGLKQYAQNVVFPLAGLEYTDIIPGQGFNASRQGGRRRHNGADYAVPTGTPLYAPFEGRITSIYEDRGEFGVHITSLDGLVTAHLNHLNRLDVSMDQLVGVADQIGLTGGDKGSWDSSVSHLDLKIKVNGQFIPVETFFANPTAYFTPTNTLNRNLGGTVGGVTNPTTATTQTNTNTTTTTNNQRTTTTTNNNQANRTNTNTPPDPLVVARDRMNQADAELNAYMRANPSSGRGRTNSARFTQLRQTADQRIDEYYTLLIQRRSREMATTLDNIPDARRRIQPARQFLGNLQTLERQYIQRRPDAPNDNVVRRGFRSVREQFNEMIQGYQNAIQNMGSVPLEFQISSSSLGDLYNQVNGAFSNQIPLHFDTEQLALLPEQIQPLDPEVLVSSLNLGGVLSNNQLPLDARLNSLDTSGLPELNLGEIPRTVELAQSAPQILRSQYQPYNELAGRLPSLDQRFSPNSDIGRALLALSLAIGTTETNGTGWRGDRLFTGRSPDNRMIGFAQYNASYHSSRAVNPQVYTSFLADMLTGRRMMPNSKFTRNVAGDLAEAVRQGQIQTGQDLINFMRNAGLGGSNWEAIGNGWQRVPGVAEDLVRFLNQGITFTPTGAGNVSTGSGGSGNVPTLQRITAPDLSGARNRLNASVIGGIDTAQRDSNRTTPTNVRVSNSDDIASGVSDVIDSAIDSTSIDYTNIENVIDFLERNQQIDDSVIEQILLFREQNQIEQIQPLLESLGIDVADTIRQVNEAQVQQLLEERRTRQLDNERQVRQTFETLQRSLEQLSQSFISLTDEINKAVANAKGFLTYEEELRFAIRDVEVQFEQIDQQAIQVLRDYTALMDFSNPTEMIEQLMQQVEEMESNPNRNTVSDATITYLRENLPLVEQGLITLQQLKEGFESGVLTLLEGARNTALEAVQNMNTLQQELSRNTALANAGAFIGERLSQVGSITQGTEFRIQAEQLNSTNTYLEILDQIRIETEKLGDTEEDRTRKNQLGLYRELILNQQMIEASEIRRRIEQETANATRDNLGSLYRFLGDNERQINPFGGGREFLVQAEQIEIMSRFGAEIEKIDELFRQFQDNPTMLNTLGALRNRIIEIRDLELEGIAQKVSIFAQSIQEPLQTAIGSLITEWAMGTKSLGEIFATFLQQVASFFAQLASQMIANQAMRWLSGLFGGVGGSIVGSIGGGVSAGVKGVAGAVSAGPALAFKYGGEVQNFNDGGAVKSYMDLANTTVIAEKIPNLAPLEKFKKVKAVGNYFNGGLVKQHQDLIGLGASVKQAMIREGANAVPAVLHIGEQVLTTRNGDAQAFRMLERSGDWDRIKQEMKTPRVQNTTPNFLNGGTVGNSNTLANNFMMSRSSNAMNNTTIFNITTPDAMSFRKSQSLIAQEQKIKEERNKRFT